VRNNVVRNTQYAGIGLYAAKDALVANNTIVNAARKGHGALYFGVPFQDWDPLAGRPSSVNPKLVNNLVIQDGGNCIDIRYSGELGGLSGLSGSANSNYNGFHNASCTFRDSRPGSGLATAGTLGQWRSATGQDANSKLAAFSVSATGHIAAGSPAIGGGIPLPQVVHDIDMHVRGTSNDIGADQVASGSNPPPTTNPPRRNRLKTPTATLPPVATPPRPRMRGPVDTGTPPARTPARPGISNPTLTTSAPAEAASDVVITSPAAAAWKTVGSWIEGAKQKLSAD
jgi:hypothetical protein